MSFDKYLGKEKRKQYYDSRRGDKTCRNHGTCKWCEWNRTFFDEKRRIIADKELRNFQNGEK